MLIEHLLLIEDDSVTRYTAQHLLEELSQVKSFRMEGDGLTAITYLSSCHRKGGFPNWILLDLRMFVMSGLEFLEEYEKTFASSHPHTKVIVFSNWISEKDRQQVSRFTFVHGFINKPLSLEKLTQMLLPAE